MRDALGGTVVIVIIVVFIVFGLAYMAFNVNYSKAFRMKNKVISTYDHYKGKCGSQCQNDIMQFANEIGYSVAGGCNGTGYQGNSYYRVQPYCYMVEEVQGGEDIPTKCYYKIMTRINVEIPIINRIFNMKVFEITGNTKIYETKNVHCN